MDKARSDDLATRLAAELDDIRTELEALATTLCLEPVMVERHWAELQRFDCLAQMIGEVARLLHTHDGIGDPIDSVRLGAMAERLAGARW